MNETSPGELFGEEHAASFDRRAKMAPMKRALHVLIAQILSELPQDAQILCVGAGTGAELIALAEAFPGWHFTAVDTAEPMLAACRERTAQLGLSERCTFHHGPVSTLPKGPPYHAATNILVSHFIRERDERVAFYEDICDRLHPGGALISADLAGDSASVRYRKLLPIWERALRQSQMPTDQVERMLAGLGTHVALIPPDSLRTLIADSGFEPPVPFFQSLLIHGCFTNRS